MTLHIVLASCKSHGLWGCLPSNVSDSNICAWPAANVDLWWSSLGGFPTGNPLRIFLLELDKFSAYVPTSEHSSPAKLLIRWDWGVFYLRIHLLVFIYLVHRYIYLFIWSFIHSFSYLCNYLLMPQWLNYSLSILIHLVIYQCMKQISFKNLQYKYYLFVYVLSVSIHLFIPLSTYSFVRICTNRPITFLVVPWSRRDPHDRPVSQQERCQKCLSE